VDLANDNLMAWRCFKKVLVGDIRARKPKEVVHLISKLTIPRHFLEYAAPKFSNFVMHIHVVRWQDLQYRVSLEMLKEGEVLSLIDFVENYFFKHQDEIQ
jgi:Cu2+-containing amine oxidase